MKIKDLPEVERPREKMAMLGAAELSDAELLAVLLRTGCGEKSAIKLAEEIISAEQGIGFLAECIPEELTRFEGIGMAKACQIVAGLELGKRIATKPKNRKVTVDNPQVIADLFMEKMRYYKKEFFNVIVLNTKGEIVAVENVAIGDLNCTVIHPREIFCCAVKKSASSVIFVHNHPSGNPSPSKEDLNITRRLVEAGNILGIKVLDHIIIGDGVFYSFKNSDLIN